MARLLAEAATALVWLTRLHLGRFLPQSPVPLAQAAWAFPLAGAVVGAISAVVLLLAGAVGLAPSIAAILAVAALVWLTGGLHEDGLADYADGCGASTRERRLEIMRDSRIGSYGVLALFLVLALRVASLAEMIRIAPVFAGSALIGAAILARAGMVVALAVMPAARPDGLGRTACGVTAGRAAVAVGLTVAGLLSMVFAGVLPPSAALSGLIAGLAAQAVLARQAQRRLGGQTGDVLGALQQVGEASALLAMQIAA